jgi:hypothetical protein
MTDRAQAFDEPLAYLIILLGVALAFVGSVVPFYGTSYRLDVPTLLLGLAPYGLYAIATVYLKGRTLVLLGVVILAAHILLLQVT